MVNKMIIKITFKYRNMKQLNKVASEAGIQRKTNRISKSASILLIAMAGFGTMSFTQDDTSVNSIDTNLSAKKERSIELATNTYAYDACCGVQVGKPGDDTKNAFYISLPKAQSFVKADRETAAKFMAEAKGRKTWSMDVAEVSVKADKEMNFNFKVSGMYPGAVVAANADQQMINHFTGDVVLESLSLNGKSAQVADMEIADQFIAENLSIKNIKPSVEMIAKADGEVTYAFEKANLPSISLPSKIAVHNSDVEMIQNYQVEVKLVNTIVANK